LQLILDYYITIFLQLFHFIENRRLSVLVITYTVLLFFDLVRWRSSLYSWLAIINLQWVTHVYLLRLIHAICLKIFYFILFCSTNLRAKLTLKMSWSTLISANCWKYSLRWRINHLMSNRLSHWVFSFFHTAVLCLVKLLTTLKIWLLEHICRFCRLSSILWPFSFFRRISDSKEISWEILNGLIVVYFFVWHAIFSCSKMKRNWFIN
jgi:hypothetical protein